MTQYRITPKAEAELEDIFAHGVERWGYEQAQRYADAVIDTFERIAARTVPWTFIPASIGAAGFRRRCGKHYVYWRASGGAVTIVTILHERMDQESRLEDLT